MKALMINAMREHYAADECRTMTVGELIRFLEDFDEDLPVILSHDSGYTFGGLRDEYFWEEEEEEE